MRHNFSKLNNQNNNLGKGKQSNPQKLVNKYELRIN